MCYVSTVFIVASKALNSPVWRQEYKKVHIPYLAKTWELGFEQSNMYLATNSQWTLIKVFLMLFFWGNRRRKLALMLLSSNLKWKCKNLKCWTNKQEYHLEQVSKESNDTLRYFKQKTHTCLLKINVGTYVARLHRLNKKY